MDNTFTARRPRTTTRQSLLPMIAAAASPSEVTVRKTRASARGKELYGGKVAGSLEQLSTRRIVRLFLRSPGLTVLPPLSDLTGRLTPPCQPWARQLQFVPRHLHGLHNFLSSLLSTALYSLLQHSHFLS